MNQSALSDRPWIEEETICEDCRAIDFSPIRRCYTQRTTVERGSSQATLKVYGNAVSVCNVGSKYSLPPSNGCVLCLALFDQRRCHVSESSRGTIDEYLIALPIMDLKSPVHGGAAQIFAEETPVLLILSPSQPSDGYILSSSDDNFWGKIANERDGPGYLICRKTKPLGGLGSDRPSAFCKDSIRGWLRTCDEHHRCNLVNQTVIDIDLIDCETRQVISATSSFQYLALSYVWGQAKTLELPERNTTNPICALPRDLPRCISDAMDVTRALGFRYLWVDQLCIDQANPERKHQQIRSMSLIYSSAQITLVAAAGDDSNFGLPNAPSWPQRSDGVNIDIGEYEILSTQKIGRLVAVEAWSGRAWTYQEGFSSRRMLIFTRSGIYYECSDGVSKPLRRSGTLHGQWLWGGCAHSGRAHPQWEPLLKEDDVKCGPHTRNQLENMDRKVWDPQSYEDILNHLIDEYFTRLEEYTNRHLSHQSDILIAFAAAIENYQKLRIDTDMLPHLESEACISRTTEHQYPTMHGLVLFGSGRKYHEHTIVQMLSFRHRICPSAHSVSRRPEFPSWSWAGWLGRATWARAKQGQLWTLTLDTSHFAQPYLWAGRAGLAKLKESLKVRLRALRDDLMEHIDVSLKDILKGEYGDAEFLEHAYSSLMQRSEVMSDLSLHQVDESVADIFRGNYEDAKVLELADLSLRAKFQSIQHGFSNPEWPYKETDVELPDDFPAVKETLELDFRAIRIPGEFVDVTDAGDGDWKWELFGRPAEIHMSVPSTADYLLKNIRGGIFELVLLGYSYRHQSPCYIDTRVLARADFGGFDWTGARCPTRSDFKHAEVDICGLILTASDSRPSTFERIGLLQCSEVLLPTDFRSRLRISGDFIQGGGLNLDDIWSGTLV